MNAFFKMVKENFDMITDELREFFKDSPYGTIIVLLIFATLVLVGAILKASVVVLIVGIGVAYFAYVLYNRVGDIAIMVIGWMLAVVFVSSIFDNSYKSKLHPIEYKFGLYNNKTYIVYTSDGTLYTLRDISANEMAKIIECKNVYDINGTLKCEYELER